ncbi:GtrA family protein [Cupriavidus basilensis]
MSRFHFGQLGRFPRFLAVGVLNMLFGFCAYSAHASIWDSPTWAALIGGNIAGIAFNFVTTGGLVFSRPVTRADSTLRALIPCISTF